MLQATSELGRYMSPQHEALEQIGRDATTWLREDSRRDLRETIERLRRYVATSTRRRRAQSSCR